MDDFLVIGSGFGGSIVAHKLALNGAKVSLLERGPWRDSMPTRSMGIASRAPFAQGGKLYSHALRTLHLPFLPKNGLTVNKNGLFEFFYNKGLNMVCSSGVGGGSHVYGGLHSRPLRNDYWDGRCEEINSTEMETHYASVMGRFDSRHPTESDQIPNTISDVFSDTPEFKKNEFTNPACGLLMPKTPGKPQTITQDNGIERKEVDWGGMHFLGSEDGAKSTLDFVYLAEAIDKGLKILDLHEAIEIRRKGEAADSQYEVSVKDLRTNKIRVLKAKKVILAAGTVNSLKVLFQSREMGGLKGMPNLGRGVGSNGDYFGAWKLKNQTANDTAGWVSTVDFSEDPMNLCLLYGPLAGIDELKIPAFLKRKLSAYASFTGMGEDAADGLAYYSNGRLQVDYDASNSTIFSDFDKAFERIKNITGNKVSTLSTPLTVHQCGGARLAQTIKEGVVAYNGEVFDNPGLFVCDSSSLPGPAGSPPSMTVAAWSSFIGEQLVKNSATSSTTGSTKKTGAKATKPRARKTTKKTNQVKTGV